MYIYHYTIKSLNDFKLKQKRGNGGDFAERPDAYFNAVDKSMNRDCPPLLMPPELGS